MPEVNLAYRSFFWSFGTTSFRTKEFNYSIERLLDLLDRFWQMPEYHNIGWDTANNPGQCGVGDDYNTDGTLSIYGIKNRFYDFMRDNEFVRGDDQVKYKAAREKTSGLVDLGLIDDNHRLTSVGRVLLDISRRNDYQSDNFLGVSKDSFIYLKQLLKSCAGTNDTVRPIIVILYLLSQHSYLTYDEFTYLAPLCTTDDSTRKICGAISNVRSGQTSIDSIIIDHFMQLENYNTAYNYFMSENVTEKVVCAVGFNRKSRNYDKPYYPLYNLLKEVYVSKDDSKIYPLLIATQHVNIGGWWRSMLFDTSSRTAIQNNPRLHLRQTVFDLVTDENSFKETFFKVMHLLKVKATLKDYLDLNRRYLKTANVFLFQDQEIKLDIVPKQFFNSIITPLYQDAFIVSPDLQRECGLEEINPALVYDEAAIISGINQELGTSFTEIAEVNTEVERIRYQRFNDLVNAKFTDERLVELLGYFETRQDDNIFSIVTDNADAPTIFEYVLGVIWYKTSNHQGKILDYLKLSLDADLLPITHAAGGEADIVYEYSQTANYPQHSMLLEATLADNTNQRRMEMEPVSRHLGNHLLRTQNYNSYCVFVTTFLHINVISDFRNRKNSYYFDSQDNTRFIQGMKIIPLDTNDLKQIIVQGKHYPELYERFENAYQSAEINPLEWYNNQVKINPLP